MFHFTVKTWKKTENLRINFVTSTVLLILFFFCSGVVVIIVLVVFFVSVFFFISSVVGWSQCNAVLYMTDISNAINYCSPHLINNYCICSFFFLSFYRVYRACDIRFIVASDIHSFSLALLFIGLYLFVAWKIHHIYSAYSAVPTYAMYCGNFQNTEFIANIALETLWIFQLQINAFRKSFCETFTNRLFIRGTQFSVCFWISFFTSGQTIFIMDIYRKS